MAPPWIRALDILWGPDELAAGIFYGMPTGVGPAVHLMNNWPWRPDLVGDPRPSNPTPDGWLDEAAFVVPRNAEGTYRYGNLRRNSLLGPGYFNLDAGLTRDIAVGSRRRQLRWEVFNVTNHPSYGCRTPTLAALTSARSGPP